MWKKIVDWKKNILFKPSYHYKSLTYSHVQTEIIKKYTTRHKHFQKLWDLRKKWHLFCYAHKAHCNSILSRLHTKSNSINITSHCLIQKKVSITACHLKGYVLIKLGMQRGNLDVECGANLSDSNSTLP